MDRLNSQLKGVFNRVQSQWKWLLPLGIITLTFSGFAIFFYLFPKWQWADWTGFGADSSTSQEETLHNEKLKLTKRITHFQSSKTLWDWLGLAGVIAIPVVLFQLQGRQQEIADTNLREEALRDYIDKIAELLIDKELKGLLKQLLEGAITKDDPKLDAALAVARARTLSILRRLNGDGERKGGVIRFLIDAKLIEGLELLENANLSNANLVGAYLETANLYRANLSEANLVGVNLETSNLYRANLSRADLERTILSKANLERANLSQANLYRAILSEANLKGAILKGAKNLTPEQVKGAKNWEQATYNLHFREKLGLPPEPAQTGTSSKDNP